MCQSIQRQQEPGRRPNHRLLSTVPPGQCSSPYLLPWVGLSFPIPLKSWGQDILMGTSLDSYVEEAESQGTQSGSRQWQLAPVAGVWPYSKSPKRYAGALCVTPEALASYCPFRALLSYSRTPSSLFLPFPPFPRKLNKPGGGFLFAALPERPSRWGRILVLVSHLLLGLSLPTEQRRWWTCAKWEV